MRGCTLRGRQFSLGVLILIVAAFSLLSCATVQPDAADKCLEAYNQYWGSNWGKVIELTTEAIQLSPDFPWAYSLRGVAYTWRGRYKEAIADLDTAIRLDPGFVPAYTNRAIAYLRAGDINRSEKDLETALRLAPGDIISLVTMAEVQSLKENADGSCRYLWTALRNGFRDLKSIETNRNFDFLFYEDCYQDITAGLEENMN